MNRSFDVIVVGGGHAGAEAALASARLGAETLLLTMNMDHIAQMSCNPAVGGIAKGQVVREVDALGGAMGRITDAAMIQFRMLNRTKGPAVWSPRAQCDKACYQRAMKYELEKQPGLSIFQGTATAFAISAGKVSGIVGALGETFAAKSLVLAPGTFMSGKLHYGLRNFPGGRAGDPASDRLPCAIREQLGLRLGRLKTGTPPRVLAKTLDFDAMQRQESETSDEYFSFFPDENVRPQTARKDMPCYLTRTTAATADVVRRNLDKSPMYSGTISGIGTRYCPSFEDKVVRFPHHETHQIYLEPEGEFTQEYYLNGISTSLPPEVQIELIRSVPGLGDAQISRYAYAIEYDFVLPDQITRSLALKGWDNVFLAGQINGTSGYEEAAGQGLVAGLNAARRAAGLAEVEFGRDSSYIGVMIDDLVTKDIVEPYRLFTSRAEYRLTLRQDNANLRLCPMARELSLLPSAKFAKFEAFKMRLGEAEALARSAVHEGAYVRDQLRKFHGHLPDTLPFPAEIIGLDMRLKEDRIIMRHIAIDLHYEGYVDRERAAVERLKGLEGWRIPVGFNFRQVKGLRNEALAKLVKVAPSTLAQASRIDGVTPAEISLLQVYLKRLSL